MPHLVEVVLQELDRIGLVRQRKKDNAEPIANFDKRGDKFCFFPELNTLTFQDGTMYAQAVQKAIDNKDEQEVRNLTERALGMVMDRLFNEFVLDLDFNAVIYQLKKLKVVDSKLEGDELASAVLAQLENYFWNSTFATSQIIQLTVTDLAYYKDAVDFQKRYKEVYALGNRLNTNTKYGRKTENTLYIAD